MGHATVPSADINGLGLFPEPLDDAEEAESLTAIFGPTYYSTASYCILGDQEAEIGGTEMADIDAVDWLPRHPSRTDQSRSGNRVRTDFTFLLAVAINPHGSLEHR